MSSKKEFNTGFEGEKTELICFAEEEGDKRMISEPWKVLIVDDTAETHEIMKMMLDDFIYKDKAFCFFSAYSLNEAKSLLHTHSDMALIFLDVVLDREPRGLELVNYIRQDVDNQLVQIIIHTGQPDRFPVDVITFNYEINDYILKSEFTPEKLLSAVIKALRTYQREITLKQQAQPHLILAEPNWQPNQFHQVINSLNIRFQDAITPALPAATRNSKNFQTALSIYLQQDFPNPEQEQQARKDFSHSLLELLAQEQQRFNQEKLTQIQNKWHQDDWFTKINQYQTEQILSQQQHRLLLLTAFPDISADCPSSFHNNLYTEIRNGIGIFLENYYLFYDCFCPVEYYSDYLKTPISGLDVQRLKEILGAIATGVLYSEITDCQVNIHLGFWPMESGEIIQVSLPIWNWEQEYNQLKEKGKQEKQALCNIREIIVSQCQLLVGFLVDWYYLNLNIIYQPQLFKLKSDFLSSWLNFYCQSLEKSFQYNQGEINYQRGINLADLQQYSRALDYLNKALELHPQTEKILIKKGQINLKLRQWQSALICFEEAIKLEPRDYLAWKGKGKALFNLLRSQEAITAFDQALTLKPDDPEIWTERGNSFYNLFCLEAAIKSYEKALAIEPTYQEAINYKRSALDNLEQSLSETNPQENETLSLPIISVIPRLDPLEKLLKESQEYFQKKQWQEALICLQEALEIEPDNYQCLKWQGFVFFNLKEWEKALQCFDKALEIKSTNYHIWTYRGRVLHCLGRFQEAIASYDRVLSIKPKYEKALKYRKSSERRVTSSQR